MRLHRVPDCRITDFYKVDGVLHGLYVDLGEGYNAVVRSKQDTASLTWQRIGTITNTFGTALWVSPEPLQSYGALFSVALVGPDSPLLGALSSPTAMSVREVAAPQSPSFRLSNTEGKVRVAIETAQGTDYAVHLMTLKGEHLATRTVVGSGLCQTVVFDNPPKQASISVVALP